VSDVDDPVVQRGSRAGQPGQAYAESEQPACLPARVAQRGGQLVDGVLAHPADGG
jgi:hypothetical protein